MMVKDGYLNVTESEFGRHVCLAILASSEVLWSATTEINLKAADLSFPFPFLTC